MKNQLICCLVLLLAVCTFFGTASGEADLKETEGALNMKMMIGETPVTVAWEQNESVDALRALAANGLTIHMSMYGGFEQVGAIGAALPRSDVQTETASGDIVLFAGDQLVVFYGHNSWAYTRLGHITDQSEEDMRRLLSQGDVDIYLTVE